MSFAERNGFTSIKPIQIDSMDETLRNRLYNITIKYIVPSPESDKIFEYVADKMGYLSVSATRENREVFNAQFLNLEGQSQWYKPYEILEYIMQAKRWLCECCDYDCHERGRACDELAWFLAFPSAINQVLEQEKAGYRMVDDIIVPITDDNELNSIHGATQTQFSSVNTHMKKALNLYANREKPDYENSIKESICAVEAICCIVTGSSGGNATLGKALKKLKDNGVVIHNAMEQAFDKLYGYTSDSDGIRHGGIDFTNAPAEDAKYMLVSCSSFINYLIEKYSQIEEATNGQN